MSSSTELPSSYQFRVGDRVKYVDGCIHHNKVRKPPVIGGKIYHIFDFNDNQDYQQLVCEYCPLTEYRGVKPNFPILAEFIKTHSNVSFCAFCFVKVKEHKHRLKERKEWLQVITR